MSIVRIGLAETKKFADGYDAIFRKRKGKDSGANAKSAKAKKASTGGKKKAKKK